MENVGTIWRQRTAAIMLDGYGWQSPIGSCVDLILTSSRLAIVATAPQRDSTGNWILGGAFAGPIGILVAGTAGSIWNSFKAAQSSRDITTDMLDNLEANKIAISGSARSLECEVHQKKRTWFAPIKACSMVEFVGNFMLGDTCARGAVTAFFDDPADKLARQIERSLPVRVKLRTGVDWDESNDSNLEMRVLGRRLEDPKPDSATRSRAT